MDLETLKKNKDYLAAQMAYYSAANAVTLGEASGALNWPFLGEDRGFETLGEAMFDYSEFVRGNPTAPAEALFRFGAGLEHHARDGATWSDVEFVWRSAFTVFHRTLPIFDELIADEIAALEAAEFRKSMAPTLAALSLPEEDTILERFGTIFEISPNMRLQMTSSPPSAPALSVHDADNQVVATEGLASADNIDHIDDQTEAIGDAADASGACEVPTADEQGETGEKQPDQAEASSEDTGTGGTSGKQPDAAEQPNDKSAA